MAVVGPVGNAQDVDRRTGFFSGEPPTPEEMAEHAAKREALIQERLKYHPSVLRIANAENEKRREAERRAANPNPRQALREAHERRAEAQAQAKALAALEKRWAASKQADAGRSRSAAA